MTAAIDVLIFILGSSFGFVAGAWWVARPLDVEHREPVGQHNHQVAPQ